MKRFFDKRAIMAGTVTAAAATGASFALAGFGFGNLYYVSVFMPFAMLGCLAVAWFMFLRYDGFAGRDRDRGRGASGVSDKPEPVHASRAEPRPAEPAIVPGIGSRGGLATETSVPSDAAMQPDLADGVPGGLDASMYAPRDGSVVARIGSASSSGHGSASPEDAGAVARAALVWAAVELGAAAAVLYSAAGLGASFYR